MSLQATLLWLHFCLFRTRCTPIEGSTFSLQGCEDKFGLSPMAVSSVSQICSCFCQRCSFNHSLSLQSVLWQQRRARGQRRCHCWQYPHQTAYVVVLQPSPSPWASGRPRRTGAAITPGFFAMSSLSSTFTNAKVRPDSSQSPCEVLGYHFQCSASGGRKQTRFDSCKEKKQYQLCIISTQV